MAYFEQTADLRPDEPDKVPEIVVGHFNPHGAIWQAFYCCGHATIEISCAKNSTYRAYGKRKYLRGISRKENAIVEQRDLIRAHFLEHVSLACEGDDVSDTPPWEEFMGQFPKTGAPTVANG
jgi:hypothetical protein